MGNDDIITDKQYMDPKRFQDYRKVISNNDLIRIIYKRLAQLEIDCQLDSDEAVMLRERARKLEKENDKILRCYSPDDDEINDFVIFLEEKNPCIVYEDLANFIKEDYGIKLKKFLKSIENYCNEDELDKYIENRITTKKRIYIDEEEYEFEEGLEILEEAVAQGLISQEEVQKIINSADQFENDFHEEFKKEKEIATVNYNRFHLTINLMMSYLLDEIDNPDNIKYRDDLIRFKYNMLTIYDSLSWNYLKNPDDFVKTDYYMDMVESHYNDYTTDDFKFKDMFYQGSIRNILDWVNTRNYYDANKLDDILALVYLRTQSSLISDINLLETVNDDKLDALTYTQDLRNQILISDSLHLDNKLVLAKKIDDKINNKIIIEKKLTK